MRARAQCRHTLSLPRVLRMAGMEVGSVILAIDGEALEGMTEAQVRDRLRHFEGTRMEVTMRLPGVKYNSQAVTKFVYFHAPPREDGPRPKSLFNGISDIFVGRKRPDLVRECEAHINMDEDGLGPSDSSDAGFVGLTVNHTKPHKVMQVYDIRDQHDCRQGDPGYQNVAVHPSDALIQVDGIDLEHKSITEVHALIRGRKGSTVELTFHRQSTRQIYSVLVKRHENTQHPQANLSPTSARKHIEDMLTSSPTSPDRAAGLQGQVGLKISTSKPYEVAVVSNLLDEARRAQGEPGYANPEVCCGDLLLEVDGRNVEHVSLGDLQAALTGSLGSVAILIFYRPRTAAQIVVRALRLTPSDLSVSLPRSPSSFFLAKGLRSLDHLAVPLPFSSSNVENVATGFPTTGAEDWRSHRNAKDTRHTRDKYLQQMHNEDLKLAQIMPTFAPTEKLWFGIETRFNAHGEHVITAVLPTSNAERNGIQVGSVIKLVDGQDVSDLDEEELRDLTRRFANQNMHITLLPPDQTELQEIIVYYHRPNHWKMSWDESLLDVGSWFTGSSANVKTTPSAPAGASKDTLNRASYADVQGKSIGIGCVLVHKSNGDILIESVKPGGGCDEAGVREGSQILSVDGRSVHDASIQTIRRWCLGPPGSTTLLGLMLPGGDVVETRVYRKTLRTDAPRPRSDLSVQRVAGTTATHGQRCMNQTEVDMNGVLRSPVTAPSERNRRHANTAEPHAGAVDCHAMIEEIIQRNLTTRRHADSILSARATNDLPSEMVDPASLCNLHTAHVASGEYVPCPDCHTMVPESVLTARGSHSRVIGVKDTSRCDLGFAGGTNSAQSNYTARSLSAHDGEETETDQHQTGEACQMVTRACGQQRFSLGMSRWHELPQQHNTCTRGEREASRESLRHLLGELDTLVSRL